MAVQTNNLLLLDITPGSATRGSPKTVASTDEIVLSPQSLDLNTSLAITGSDFTVNSSGQVSLATGGSTLDVQSPNINIGTVTSGDEANATVDIGSSGSVVAIAVEDNNATGFTLSEGANVYVLADTTNGAERLVLASPGRVIVQTETMFESAPVGVKIEASEALAAGNVVTIYGSGNPGSQLVPKVKKASASEVDADERLFSGVITSASISSGNNGYAASVAGTVVSVTFKASDAPAAGSVGAPVYVSSEAGKAQMTPPTSGTVYRIGMLLSETAISGSLYAVQLQPLCVAVIPA
jgi:hypothetical protein